MSSLATIVKRAVTLGANSGRQQLLSRVIVVTNQSSIDIKFISNQPFITSGHKKKVSPPVVSPKNMSLRYCSPIPVISMPSSPMDAFYEGLDVGEETVTIAGRPLAVILSWMLAKDSHLEKYRQMWFRRGFDVLTVKTSPLDLLLPPIGGQVVAANLIRYLSQINPKYDEIVIHAFSVGGYQYGEVMRKLIASPEEHRELCRAFKGIIIDSMVHWQDCAPGLSRAISTNPVLQPLLEMSIKTFVTLTHSVSMAHYHKSTEQIFGNPLKLPGLLLYSTDDVVSNVSRNESLANRWREVGVSVDTKCWQRSTHVLHYRDHQYEYEHRLDAYLKKLRLKSALV
ncbi:unnamed protein product [Medioppia subpectinata]|uniref:Transmembrane protein 53 n=1 Tax=Medioppia subpectinata TaxID=1979941 RepID=A0A7R9Q7T1_9ACAR|nr:unnamed protein product [Medioppia subpectinata]CAG2116075.1 unnamed protein product [Medioppia subpectinata]